MGNLLAVPSETVELAHGAKQQQPGLKTERDRDHGMTNYPESPREAARRFTPELTALVDNPLYSDVWTDPRLSPRDRSIATLAALTVLYRPEELPAHLRRAVDNGLTLDEISALITHVAFYGGFPAAISASMLAAETLLNNEEGA